MKHDCNVNPFTPNAPFLYPLKTTENLMVFWCFQGVEKRCIGKESVNNDLLTLDHHVIKAGMCLSTDRLTWTEFYSILLLENSKELFSAKYFKKLFSSNNLEWSAIYILPLLGTVDIYLRSFQYKIVNNTLSLNEKLFLFGLKKSALCSFSNPFEETPIHMFCKCYAVISPWKQLKTYLNVTLSFLPENNLRHI